MSFDQTTRSVAIVGAGIVGSALAFRIAGRGYHVTVFDPGLPGERGPSRGNAGHIAGSDIFPISSPGIATTGLKMLLDRNGPLKIAPTHLLKLLPWLTAFIRTGKGRAFEDATRAISSLCAGSVDATERLFAEAGIASMFRRVPALYVYDSMRSLEASREDWAAKAKAGHSSEEVTRTRLRDLEPHLADRFAAGVLSYDWAEVTEPYDVVFGLFKAAQARGVAFQKTEVQSVSCSETGTSVVADGKVYRFDRMIIAAGVWSAKLADQLGDRLPVEAEGGYNITYSEPGIVVSHPIVFSDHGIVSTNLRTGLRIGGWAEYAGLNAPARAGYFDRMATISQSMFPELNSANGTRWAGRRPSTPDSVPVISVSIRNPNVYYATGHGHYGLSWAARTAEILLDLLEGGATEAAPFSIRRFNKAV